MSSTRAVVLTGPSSTHGELWLASATGNHLLNALPDSEREAIAPLLIRARHETGHMVVERGQHASHVYFPITGVVSIIARMANGSVVEVGTVGNEGFAGVSVLLGGGIAEGDTFFQLAGESFHVPAAQFMTLASSLPVFHRLLKRYTQAYLSQLSQSVACNRLHDIEQRCARWLLMTHDRLNLPDVILLRQEYLAMMLGVQRPGVTLAAGALQDAGYIRYRRGRITILDRPGLIGASCECYGVVRTAFDALLPD